MHGKRLAKQNRKPLGPSAHSKTAWLDAKTPAGADKLVAPRSRDPRYQSPPPWPPLPTPIVQTAAQSTALPTAQPTAQPTGRQTASQPMVQTATQPTGRQSATQPMAQTATQPMAQTATQPPMYAQLSTSLNSPSPPMAPIRPAVPPIFYPDAGPYNDPQVDLWLAPLKQNIVRPEPNLGECWIDLRSGAAFGLCKHGKYWIWDTETLFGAECHEKRYRLECKGPTEGDQAVLEEAHHLYPNAMRII